MSANQVAWPMGMSDQDPSLGARPLAFNPQGFLVAILQDADQAEQAKATLAQAGFAERDLRVNPTPLILFDPAGSGPPRPGAGGVVGPYPAPPDTIELYFGYAREGCSALWVHVPEEADAKRAIRGLADHQVLHIRYYGHDRQDDLHIG